MSKFKHCGRGVCAAEAGHKGTCAQASGWDEFTADAADRAYESGLADGRASVVIEEPEWEYGVKWPGGLLDTPYDDEDEAREDAEGVGGSVFRRRAPGPWVPLEN